MEDRVGDILAQRARLESGGGAAIVFSVLFHAALTAIAAWSAWHSASHDSTPVMMIRFAQQKPSVDITPAAPAVAAPKPAPAPVAKKIEKPKPADIRKTAPPSPFGKSAKKAAEPPPVPAARPSVNPSTTAAATSTAPDVPVGGSGVTALEGGDFPYPFYIEQMKRLIGSHWLRPTVSGN